MGGEVLADILRPFKTKQFSVLEKLDVSRNTISSKGGRTVCEIISSSVANLPVFQELLIHGNELTVRNICTD